MRLLHSAVALMLFALPLSALELEESRSYAVDAARVELRILSTADADVFEPIILAFQQQHGDIAIQYDVASSTDVMDAPEWATWRDQVFAFTQEPTVLVVSTEVFSDLDIPKNRQSLIRLLRENPDVFDGKVGTYDVRTSGAGYLFATQDSRNTESYWQLTEVMGRLNAKLYCCSGQMISDVADGSLAIAYNVLGSYAQTRLKETPGIQIVQLDDFVSVMLRTAIIPNTARSVADSGLMIDFLSGLDAYPELNAQTGLPPIVARDAGEAAQLRPIRLGPGLLVFLDRMRRETFLRSWTSSMEQP